MDSTLEAITLGSFFNLGDVVPSPLNKRDLVFAIEELYGETTYC